MERPGRLADRVVSAVLREMLELATLPLLGKEELGEARRARPMAVVGPTLKAALAGPMGTELSVVASTDRMLQLQTLLAG